ncbi:torso-like protein isoform X2 [Procambarus clarkii]|nr:torso-like protein [Procambarus clarkii]XP_045598840.1 torso-like protein [Procambarus clarkii]
MNVSAGSSWATLVLAVCVLCGEAKDGSSRTRDVQDNDLDSSDEYLKVGRSLNLLPRYGFLTLSIKVFPHRSDNSWLFREKTAEVFQKNSYWATQTHQAPAETDHRGYDQHFLIDFCDDARDLLTAYFDNFYVEGVPEPHRVFTSSISAKTNAQHLGINPTFLSSEYSFVLVRLFRKTRRATLDGQLTLTSHFKSSVGDIRIGSSESVNQFLDHYGTHVITEYEVGDVMYQVYVFGERTYTELKNNFAMSQTSQTELTRMERYFTPYYALHVGKVKLASGSPQFKIISDQLLSVTFFRLYQSIFSIFKDQELEKKLEELDGEVVLSLKLEKITKIVPKSPERHWLGEVLDNTLSLYYVTM